MNTRRTRTTWRRVWGGAPPALLWTLLCALPAIAVALVACSDSSTGTEPSQSAAPTPLVAATAFEDLRPIELPNVAPEALTQGGSQAWDWNVYASDVTGTGTYSMPKQYVVCGTHTVAGRGRVADFWVSDDGLVWHRAGRNDNPARLATQQGPAGDGRVGAVSGCCKGLVARSAPWHWGGSELAIWHWKPSHGVPSAEWPGDDWAWDRTDLESTLGVKSPVSVTGVVGSPFGEYSHDEIWVGNEGRPDDPRPRAHRAHVWVGDLGWGLMGWIPVRVGMSQAGAIDELFVFDQMAVALGRRAVGRSDWPQRLAPALWVSLDGSYWARVEGPGFKPGMSVVDIIRGGPGYIACGTAPVEPATTPGERREAALWTSTDCLEWTRVDGFPAPDHYAHTGTGTGTGDELAGGNTSLWRVASVDGRFAALGGAEEGSSGYLHTLVYTSSDGLDWRLDGEIPELAGYSCKAVLGPGGRLVVAGIPADRGTPVAFWTATFAGVN